MSDLKDNPFSALFTSVKDAQTFSNDRQTLACNLIDPVSLNNVENQNTDKETETVENNLLHNPQEVNFNNEDENEKLQQLTGFREQVNSEIENVFLITLNKSSGNSERPPNCVYLYDLHVSEGIDNLILLDLENIEAALFERLMLQDPENFVVETNEMKSNAANKEAAMENKILLYLFQSYCRLDRTKSGWSEVINKFQTTIFRNIQMALLHPIVFPNFATKKSDQEFLDLLIEYVSDSNMSEFINGFIEFVEQSQLSEDEPTVMDTLRPTFDLLTNKLRTSSIIDPKTLCYIQIAQLITSRVSSALAFMAYSTPMPGEDPKAYERSLLGSMLNISCLPKSPNGPYEFFNNPARLTQMEQENTERILWTPLKRLSIEVHRLLLAMLRLPNPEIKNSVCSWIGNCLQDNSGRFKLWHHLTGVRNINYVSDGFILNLTSVLLRMCEPIIDCGSSKLLLVDPTFCAAEVLSSSEASRKGIHLGGLSEETCLLTATDNRPQKDSYNFITECFYMTHKSLQIGFHSLHEQIVKLVTEIRRLQRLYTEAVESGGESSEAAESVKRSMEQGSTIYFSARAHMLEPTTLNTMLLFYAATSKWLVNLAVSEDYTVFKQVELPIPPSSPECLHCIPEFIIDNITDFTSFLRRFAAHFFEVSNGDFFLVKLLNLILVYMGSPERMKNPHLRAKLAEVLENIMPHPDESNPHLGDTTIFARQEVFRNHPHSFLIVPELMHVFVSIEMTGQSVAFEQKFNYRRPMYEVLEYVWNTECHKEAFRKLAIESEKAIKNPDPPLFLRFINLLMNDANYLLDEGLMHVSKLRDHQQRRETEEYSQLSAQQKQEAENLYKHTGMLARFHNIMGRQTIKTLKMLTGEIKSIFVHPINVERIANMLNYFLVHLVGPKQKQLKLKDKEEFDFKPQDLVSGICHIYVNLRESKRFLKAVANDGRSYSADLLVLAENVLCKIGEVCILADFQNLATEIKEISDRLKKDEEALENVPEEFLDAILGTIMKHPVILPSSMVAVDRSTIARHLLSDQTDPFNRSPLTMDMVKEDEELKERIQNWMKSNCNKQKESN